MTPEGVAAPARKPSRDETLVKALVRAHRWRRRIESGQAKSITDLAEQEGVAVAYVCRLLPLTCLAPDIVEAILDGRQPKGLRLAEMLENGPLGWEEQRSSSGKRHPFYRPNPTRSAQNATVACLSPSSRFSRLMSQAACVGSSHLCHQESASIRDRSPFVLKLR
jgi:hypothetical protein